MAPLRPTAWAGLVVVAILTHGRAAMAASLSLLQLLEDDVAGIDGVGGAERIVGSPDGRHIYVSGSADEAVAVFGRDLATGRLAPVQIQHEPFLLDTDHPAGMVMSPDGAHLYVSVYVTDMLVVFARDPSTGGITPVQTLREADGVDGVTALQNLAISPDGAHVYTIGYEVGVFARHPSTGLLTFVQTRENGEDGVQGLINGVAITVSPDGAHVYVACDTSGDAVLTFARDATTGELTFVEVQHDGVGGVDGIAASEGIAVSPDGRHVYVAGHGDGALALFNRNPTTGRLSFVEAVRSQAAPDVVAVSPDGTSVVTGSFGGDVGLFVRDPATGHVSLAATRNIAGTIAGLEFTPDGANFYTAATTGSVGNLRPVLLTCSATPLDGCGPSSSGAAAVDVRDLSGIDHDRLKWKWRASGSPLAFGDPTSTRDYALCVYDASPAPQPLLSAVAPGGDTCGRRACWKAAGSDGFRFSDATAAHGGLVKILLKRSATGGEKIEAKGAAGALRVPAPPLALPVRLQLQTNAAPCWETTFSTAQVNGAGRFKARGD